MLTILNHWHHHRGFVYQHARFGADNKSIEVDVGPREGSTAVCSGCHRPAPGYDHLPERGFEFIPQWGFLVFLPYRMRRVDGRDCGVVIEEVPSSDGKHQLTRAYMLFLARWARKLSWKETAESFHTSWDKVCDAMESVVTWGLEHRTLESIHAIGADEIQYAKGHKYLTLVYQIDQGLTHLLHLFQKPCPRRLLRIPLESRHHRQCPLLTWRFHLAPLYLYSLWKRSTYSESP
jgi:transposase